MKIVFEPFCGLGNRMRALDSVLPLARRLNAELEILWRLDGHLNCRFEDLFQTPAGVSRIRNVEWNLREEIFVHARRFLYPKFIDQRRMGQLIKDEYDFEDLASYRRVFIKTYSRFYASPPLYRDFVPVPALRTIIDRYALDERFVGVHVRRGDNKMATAESPLSAFVDLMTREIDDDVSVAFFVATDSPDVEQCLRDTFGDRIVCHEKASLDRSEPAAVQDALVDLFCLSRCRKIIGSYWSSFSNTAARLRGVQIVTVRK